MYKIPGFKPGIFCSVGGRDVHYATPPRHFKNKEGIRTQDLLGPMSSFLKYLAQICTQITASLCKK
jgi:hypothetical protein